MQATAIARSAFREIDWMREPLTERECKIRRALLDKRLDGGTGSLGILVLLPGKLRSQGRTKAAQDWRAAYAKARAFDDAERLVNDRAELRDAIAVVDGDETLEEGEA